MQLSSIVAERERGLRQALTTAGMLDSAFWVSWLFVELIISVIFSLLLIGFGAMFGFAFFLKNSFSLVFMLFLLFQWSMVGVAFILSAFISKTSTAINVGFVIFIFGWIIQTAVAFNYPYAPEYYQSIVALTVIFTLIPPAPLAKGSIDLGAAGESGKSGITWQRRSEYCQNLKDNPTEADALYRTDPNGFWDFSCVFPLGTILLVLAIEFIVYTAIAIYLDNVFANENGVKKKPWYFLTPSYWVGGNKTKAGVRRLLQSPKPCPIDVAHIDEDVAAEEASMKASLRYHATGKSSVSEENGDHSVVIKSRTSAVEVFGLQKAFNRPFCRGCCGCGTCAACCHSIFCSSCCGGKKSNKKKGGSFSPFQNSKEFWAIKGSWFSIAQGQLFCLLGPNGAGKTTTINCLTGVLPPTGGDALVYNESITAAGGLDRIRSVMGVCPQFDVLWDELTGFEHLLIYGRVKGLSRKSVLQQSADLLESVKLTSAASQCTMQYSGGMKRRLSVAIALLGDPLIVYLDEPTTGMDPISRRHVWDAIENAKQGRAIVLTTHSMEEADILGDNVAIMARGRLRAFGSSLRLKQRFGSGYELSVAVAGTKSASSVNLSSMEGRERIDAVVKYFEEELGTGQPEEGSGAYVVFRVPKDKERMLSAFLNKLEYKKQELGITDVQISLTSLEEVFLSIAKKAELEAAAAEGRATLDVTLEDGTLLEVPLGEELAVQESTGRQYAIKWAQDENGELQVLSWSLIDSSNQTMKTAGAVQEMSRQS